MVQMQLHLYFVNNPSAVSLSTHKGSTDTEGLFGFRGKFYMKQRSDGRWVKKITLPNGKSKYFYSTEPTERKATADIAQQLLLYQEKQEQGMLFQNIAEEWEDKHFPTLQENTLKQYRAAKKDVVEYFKDKPITSIKPAHVSAMISQFASDGYAQKTVKARLLVMSLICKFAIISQYIEANPCQYVEIPKNLPKSKREDISKEESELIKKNYDKPFGVFALFLLMTGCRRGEALALEPEDIDWEKGIVHINKTTEWHGNKPYIKPCPKTEAGVRDIPIPEFMLNLLKPFKNQKYLFANERGELMNNSQVTRAWRAYQKATGITATPHQLRHHFASMLYDANIDVKSAQRLLGHADIKTTMDVYVHLSETRKDSSAQKLIEYMNNNFLDTK